MSWPSLRLCLLLASVSCSCTQSLENAGSSIQWEQLLADYVALVKSEYPEGAIVLSGFVVDARTLPSLDLAIEDRTQGFAALVIDRIGEEYRIAVQDLMSKVAVQTGITVREYLQEYGAMNTGSPALLIVSPLGIDPRAGKAVAYCESYNASICGDIFTFSLERGKLPSIRRRSLFEE